MLHSSAPYWGPKNARIASSTMVFPVPFLPVSNVTPGDGSLTSLNSMCASSKGPMFFRSRA